ncbi:MAG: hypothetical protein QXR73_01310 [Candidatus Micrarchaeaceae archaeon]
MLLVAPKAAKAYYGEIETTNRWYISELIRSGLMEMGMSKLQYGYKSYSLYERGRHSQHPFINEIYERLDYHYMSDKNTLRLPRPDGSDYYEFQNAVNLISIGNAASYDEVIRRYGSSLDIIETLAININDIDYLKKFIETQNDVYAVAFGIMNKAFEPKSTDGSKLIQSLLFGNGNTKNMIITIAAVSSEPDHETLMRILAEQEFISQKTAIYHLHDIEAISWLSENSTYKDIRSASSYALKQLKKYDRLLWLEKNVRKLLRS